MTSQLLREFKATIGDLPAAEHPWFKGLVAGEFSVEQLVAGEQQHYLRGRLNHKIFGTILAQAQEEGDAEVIAVAQENYDEEIGGTKTHGDLMYQFLEEQGITKEQAAAVEPMPGTMAAISMLTKSIEDMTALEAIAMMSLPELQNGPISAAAHKALQKHYNFSDYAIETYSVHSEADIGHGEVQLALLAAKVEAQPELEQSILRAMRFGVVAFNFEWDGHYQALSGNEHFYWQGTGQLSNITSSV